MATTASANPSFVPQSPSHWVADEKRSSCKSCHKDFTFFNRRHHCRSCREVFCGDCSDYRLLTRDPKDPSVVTSVRACHPCFDKFRGRKARGPKANSGKVRRNSRAEAEQPPPAEQQAQPNSQLGVEMPTQHFNYEGEDDTITGQETIKIEEDEDHYVYPDGQHQEHPQGHTVTLFTVLGPDGQPVDAGRDTVMAAQGSVVLPSSHADGGLQFVHVDQSNTRAPATAAPAATVTPYTTLGTTPSDTAAIFQESHMTARTPINSTYQAADKTALAAAGGGEKDEFDRSGGGAVEGSDEIMNIPSDALATVKNSELMARHQQHSGDKEGEVAYSERNVENHFNAPSPVAGVPLLFKEGEQGEQQKSSSNMVV